MTPHASTNRPRVLEEFIKRPKYMIDARSPVRRLVLVHGLLFLVLFARRPDVLTNAQFWGEDGAVFFVDQLKFGFLHAASSTYAGYYHLLPRLIAAAASGLSTKYVPFAYNLTALLIAAMCCGFFAWPVCRHLIPSDALRIFTCFLASITVYAGNEVIGDITNLQWFLLVASLLLVSYLQTPEPKPVWVTISSAIAGLLIALSAPLTVTLGPLLVWQIFRKKGAARLPALCMLVGALWQSFAFLRSSEPHTSLLKMKLSLSFVAVVTTEIARPVLTTVLGHQYLVKGNDIGVVSKLIAALTVVSVWLTRLYSRIDNRDRTILTVAIYFSLVVIAMIMTGRNLAVAFTDWVDFRHLEGERYFFPSAMMFVYIVAFWIDRIFGPRNAVIKCIGLVLLFSCGMAKNFSLPPLPDFHWSSYADRIDDWTARRDKGEHPPKFVVPINPAPMSITFD